MTKQWTQEVTLDKMAHELVIGGIDKQEAEERARNIYQACIFGPIDYREVAMMISPTEITKGIEEPLERYRTASQCLAVFVASVSPTYFSLWVGLMQWLGFSPEQAREWIYNRADISFPR